MNEEVGRGDLLKVLARAKVGIKPPAAAQRDLPEVFARGKVGIKPPAAAQRSLPEVLARAKADCEDLPSAVAR